MPQNILQHEYQQEIKQLPTTCEKKMESKRRRQAIYLDALDGLNNFKIFEGHFLAKTITCKTCGYSWLTHEEKMTDVNIATELIMDAHNDNFDVAMIISGDKIGRAHV